MRKNRGIQQFGMSFMDIICCGFGAIVLLLVITENSEGSLEAEALEASLMQLKAELRDIEKKKRDANSLLESFQTQENSAKELITDHQADLIALLEELKRSEQALAEASADKSVLASKLDSRPSKRPQTENRVAGIPLDAEYIIFVIDSSGSMVSTAWELMIKIMGQILDVYPKVKGLQVMNDMGVYLFPNFSGTWIPDTPARRRVVLSRLKTWSAFSNSSPVEGIEKAINTYHSAGSNIAIYVLGDEFAGQSTKRVLDRVDRINTGRDGQKLMRIHAIGFPVIFQITRQTDPSSTGTRFGILMRELTQRNEGAFVGLSKTRP